MEICEEQNKQKIKEELSNLKLSEDKETRNKNLEMNNFYNYSSHEDDENSNSNSMPKISRNKTYNKIIIKDKKKKGSLLNSVNSIAENKTINLISSKFYVKKNEGLNSSISKKHSQLNALQIEKIELILSKIKDEHLSLNVYKILIKERLCTHHSRSLIEKKIFSLEYLCFFVYQLLNDSENKFQLVDLQEDYSIDLKILFENYYKDDLNLADSESEIKKECLKLISLLFNSPSFRIKKKEINLLSVNFLKIYYQKMIYITKLLDFSILEIIIFHLFFQKTILSNKFSSNTLFNVVGIIIRGFCSESFEPKFSKCLSYLLLQDEFNDCLQNWFSMNPNYIKKIPDLMRINQYFEPKKPKVEPSKFLDTIDYNNLVSKILESKKCESSELILNLSRKYSQTNEDQLMNLFYSSSKENLTISSKSNTEIKNSSGKRKKSSQINYISSFLIDDKNNPKKEGEASSNLFTNKDKEEKKKI